MKYFKKTIVRVNYLLLLMLSISCTSANSSKSEETVSDMKPASEVIMEMGPGFNLGNTFDNGINSTDPDTIIPILIKYKNAGMHHVRIPTTWLDSRLNVSGNEYTVPESITYPSVIYTILSGGGSWDKETNLYNETY